MFNARKFSFFGFMIVFVVCMVYFDMDQLGTKLAPEWSPTTGYNSHENGVDPSTIRVPEPVPSVIPSNDTTFGIVVVVGDQKNKDLYEYSLNTIKCYAEFQGYNVYYIDISSNITIQQACNQTDIMFRRHCATELVMRSLKEEWIVFIDADIGVINPVHRLEQYLQGDTYQIIFYDRFYNDEIASGSYLVRNSAEGRGFLKFWSDYIYKAPKVPQHGSDNGALHSAVVEYFHPHLDKRRNMCEMIWRRSKDYGDLFDYESCMREIMKEESSNKFYVFPKGIGWCRDGWLSKGKWSYNDFMFHGWKKEKIGGEWDFQFKNDSFTGNCKGVKGLQQWKYLQKYLSSPTEVWAHLDVKLNSTTQEHNDRIKRLRETGVFTDPVIATPGTLGTLPPTRTIEPFPSTSLTRATRLMSSAEMGRPLSTVRA